MTSRLNAPGAWQALRRELALALRDRTVWAWWLVVLCLAALAIAGGLREVRHQHATITRMLQADAADRHSVQLAQRDWGSAAYYSFHLTFDPPSDLAFAALGRRDDTAWRHRIRMLALEGQIHERDAGHPVLALIGRFDFAFLAAFVLPLVLIALLHDLRTSERRAGRHDLLVATARSPSALWGWRALVRSGGVLVAALAPLLVGCAFSGTAPSTMLAAGALVTAYLLGWTLLIAVASAWRQAGEVILATLLAAWIMVAVVVPAAGRTAIDRAIPIPAGADIIMTQREAVNDAWDLPKAHTMSSFVARHPEWAASSTVERPFEWKWYYAFQQVGDQQAEALSQAYTQGRRERDRWAARLAWLAPPVLLERALQALAQTDLRTALRYEDRVREFHGQLRAFYYPRLFLNEPFDLTVLTKLPRFDPVSKEP